jgi:hypothetical protein
MRLAFEHGELLAPFFFSPAYMHNVHISSLVTGRAGGPVASCVALELSWSAGRVKVEFYERGQIIQAEIIELLGVFQVRGQ